MLAEIMKARVTAIDACVLDTLPPRGRKCNSIPLSTLEAIVF
jgi:hypothetical protein